MLIKFFLIAQIVLSRTGFVDAGSEHALHQAYLLLPPAVCPAGFIGQNKSQEAVPRALHWDHLTSTVTSTETSWHPDKSSSLFDVPFSGLGSTERARMLIKFFLLAQFLPLGLSGTLLHHWCESASRTFRDYSARLVLLKRACGIGVNRQLDKSEWQCTLENKTLIVKVWWFHRTLFYVKMG
nr:uncharacterized protein LOC126538776 isoform X8 [Dermacentor andersoni]XP_054931011.1 uncharacterized protein LOC126538776 isoform X8 [Dermacentor andersoni]